MDGRYENLLIIIILNLSHTHSLYLGYLLTGRHGVFTSYEAFIRIVDSMISQHAKWLKMCSEIPWYHIIIIFNIIIMINMINRRKEISSFNYLLTSHVWRQDHNGFTHQDPGFIDHLVTKKAAVSRIYLPPDANNLLCVTDITLKSRNCKIITITIIITIIIIIIIIQVSISQLWVSMIHHNG